MLFQLKCGHCVWTERIKPDVVIDNFLQQDTNYSILKIILFRANSQVKQSLCKADVFSISYHQQVFFLISLYFLVSPLASQNLTANYTIKHLQPSVK